MCVGLYVMCCPKAEINVININKIPHYRVFLIKDCKIRVFYFGVFPAQAHVRLFGWKVEYLHWIPSVFCYDSM
jgi:hypothetical protein